MKRLFGCLLLASFALVGCSLAGDVTPPPGLEPPPGPRATVPQPDPVDVSISPPSLQPDPAAGAAIYAEKCAACHGAAGGGDGPQAANLPNPPAALGDPVVARAAVPSDWYTTVTLGNIERFMPGFTSLSDAERWDVVAYALTLHTPADASARGAELFELECAECHGPEAAAENGPMLADPIWMAQNSLAEIFAVVSSGLEGAAHVFGSELGEADQWALAAFVQSLSFSDGTGEPVAAQPEPASEVDAPVEGTGALVARVTNASQGGEVPGDLEITLNAFDGSQESLSQTATVDENGSVVFEDLERVPGRLFIVSAEYGGVRYASEVAHLIDENPLELPLTIFESTTDSGTVSVDRLHLLFDVSEEGIVRVIELWLISNLGDRTLTGDRALPALEIALPQDAVNLQFEDGVIGGRYQLTGAGFGDLAPLRPGQGSGQLVFSMEFPYDRGFEFVQPVDYPVQALTVLVPEGGLRIEGDGLEFQGVQDVTGVRLENYSAGPIAPGEIVSLNVSLRSGNPLTDLSPLSWILGIGALLGAALAAGYWLLRPPGVEPGEVSVEAEPVEVNGAAQRDLLQQIARLDDAYEAGDLDEKAYRRQREEAKGRLMDLMRPSHD